MEWIKIEDQLPKDYENVLYYEGKTQNKMIGAGYFVWSQTPVDYVTHWMPLPKPPKEIKDK